MLNRNDPQLPFYISLAALVMSVAISTTSVAYSIAAVKEARAKLEDTIEQLPKADDSNLKAAMESLERTVGAHGKIMREMVKGMGDIRQDYADRLTKLEMKIDALPKGRR